MSGLGGNVSGYRLSKPIGIGGPDLKGIGAFLEGNMISDKMAAIDGGRDTVDHDPGLCSGGVNNRAGHRNMGAGHRGTISGRIRPYLCAVRVGLVYDRRYGTTVRTISKLF